MAVSATAPSDAEAAPPLPPLVTYKDVVLPAQCDQMGHLSTFAYSRMFYVAAYHFFHEIGARFGAGDDHGWADVRQEFDYLREVRSGGLIVIHSGVVSVGRSSIRSRHLMTDADGLVRHAAMEVVTVRFDLAARASAPLPEDVAARARQLLAMA